jgi:hypothetical protein
VYLEPCLVCNPVTVSEGRSGRMMISGHIMDGSTRKKDEVHSNNLVTYNFATRRSSTSSEWVKGVGIPPKSGFGPKRNTRPQMDYSIAICTCEQICQAIQLFARNIQRV